VTQLIDVVGAVLVRDGAVLAAQRGPGMALAGHWEFPGGKIEPGESPQQALVRGGLISCINSRRSRGMRTCGPDLVH